MKLLDARHKPALSGPPTDRGRRQSGQGRRQSGQGGVRDRCWGGCEGARQDRVGPVATRTAPRPGASIRGADAAASMGHVH
jgi:hypothetical protein